MNEIPSIRQRESVFFFGGKVNVGSSTGYPASANDPNFRLYKFDHVVNDIARLYMSAG